MNEDGSEKQIADLPEPDSDGVSATETENDITGELPLNSFVASRIRSAAYNRALCVGSRWLLTFSAIVFVLFSAIIVTIVPAVPTYAGSQEPEYVPFATCLAVVSAIDAVLLVLFLCIYVHLGNRIRVYDALIHLGKARLSELTRAEHLRMLLSFPQIDNTDLQTSLINRLAAIVNSLEPGEDIGLSGNEWKQRLEHAGTEWLVDPTPLLVAIIKMFERNRDPVAIDVIRRLASDGGWMIAGKGVWQAACESLPALEAALLERRQTATLLRASSANAAPNEELLRAASPSNTTRPEVLLRPSSSDSER